MVMKTPGIPNPSPSLSPVENVGVESCMVDTDGIDETVGAAPAAATVGMDTVAVITLAGDANVDVRIILVVLEFGVGIELVSKGMLVVAVVRERSA